MVRVSMPSRAVTSFLLTLASVKNMWNTECQCPLGLLPHFYAGTHLGEWTGVAQCQCPLGLLPHFYADLTSMLTTETVHSCQCPLGLLPHFYNQGQAFNACILLQCQCPLGLLPHFYQAQAFRRLEMNLVSMPSRAVTSFLQEIDLL